MIRNNHFFLFVIVLMLLYSCSPVRKMGPNAVLLNKNVIKSDEPKYHDGINGILKQKPNRRILGVFRFHLGVYTLFNQGKDTKVKAWFRRTVGEEPVLLDTLLTERSRVQIKQYMENKGYFNAEVTDTTVYKRKGTRAKVYYFIKAGRPYTIREIRYIIKDTMIRAIVMSDTASSLVKRGKNYDTEMFQGERERVTTLLKNHGYFYFTQQFINYRVDSALKSFSVDVNYYINNPSVASDDSLNGFQGRHQPYNISRVFVKSDYDPLKSTTSIYTDTVHKNENTFLFKQGKYPFRPTVLSNKIYLKENELYTLEEHENTYNSLSELGNFRFINVNFERDSIRIDSLPNPSLTCFINLTPGLRQGYRVEIEGTHNGGNLGTAGSLIYSNRNVFRGAELVEFKFKAAFEDQRSFSGEEQKIFLFNTYEFGPELSISIPRLLWPFKSFKPKYKSASPITNFTVSYNLQQRPEFFRRTANFSASFSFKQSRYVSHQFAPAEINFVIVKQDDSFRDILLEIGDQGLIESYDDHLIAGGRYSFILNTQQLNKLKNFIYLRFNLESAGNSIRLADELSGRVTKKDSSYAVFNNIYAQYLKPDFDLRYYHLINENSTLVYRFAAGIGIPYLNSKALPFEKSFFAGGANDLRAFSARTLGPGSYSDERNVQQSGEIKLNANVEYRFDIFRVLQGAFFADAGNVWLTKEDVGRPGGKFDSDKFLNEIAIGSGIGFRFNFTYFIFRLDFGFPMRDPRMEESKRWVYKKLQLRDGVANFGIGFPF